MIICFSVNMSISNVIIAYSNKPKIRVFSYYLIHNYLVSSRLKLVEQIADYLTTMISVNQVECI